MSGRAIGWRLTLLAVIVVGLVGFAGPFTSGATFTDAHDATGNVTAAEKFSAGGDGGATADAGGPYDVIEGGALSLDGSSSSGQGPLSYDWNILSGPGYLSDNTTATPVYHAPADITGDTTVTVEVSVTDNHGTTTDTAQITVTDGGATCGNAGLEFCSLSVSDASSGPSQPSTQYDVSYSVSDPSGGSEFGNVTVTLRHGGAPVVTDSATTESGSITVSESGNNIGSSYTVVVRLYDQSGSVVECRQVTDEADGTDPSAPTSC